MKGFVDRLEWVIKRSNLSVPAFSSAVGASRNMVTELRSGRNKSLTGLTLEKIAKQFDVNLHWLVTGEGPPESPHATQVSTLEPPIDKDIRKALDGLIKVIEKKGSGKTPQADVPTETRPVLDLGSIAAGPLTQEISKHGKVIQLPKEIIPGKEKVFFLTVRGDSMEGLDIFAGDKAFFREVHDPSRLKSGAVIAALVNDENTLKSLIREGDKVLLRAANPKYKDIVLNDGHSAVVQGEMIYLLKDWRTR